MTKREVLNAIVAGTIDAEALKAYATDELKALDTKNAKRAVKAAEKKAEVNEPLYKAIDEILADGEAHLAGEIAEVLGVTVPKVAALVKGAGDKYAKVEVKVEKGKKVAYKFAQ